jgi:hypothetical protein
MLVARRTVNELTPSSARERTGGVLSVANKHERALVRSLEERMCEPVCVLWLARWLSSDGASWFAVLG